MRRRFLIYVLSLLTLSSTLVATAQTNGGKSRLHVGEETKTPPVKNNLSVYVVAPLATEISYNKSKAINDFYRNVLLSSKSVAVASAKAVTSSEPEEDALFSNNKILVSNIFPNPASRFAQINYEIKENGLNAELTFYDMLARKVATYDLDSFDRNLRVDVQNWESGIYLYQLTIDGKKVATKKLLVRHN